MLDTACISKCAILRTAQKTVNSHIKEIVYIIKEGVSTLISKNTPQTVQLIGMQILRLALTLTRASQDVNRKLKCSGQSPQRAAREHQKYNVQHI